MHNTGEEQVGEERGLINGGGGGDRDGWELDKPVDL